MRIRKGTVLRAVLITAAVAAFALIGGSSRSAADTTLQCNPPDPQGRNFCVTIEALDNVSPSGTFGAAKGETPVTAFQYCHVFIQNDAQERDAERRPHGYDAERQSHIDGIVRRRGLVAVLHAKPNSTT